MNVICGWYIYIIRSFRFCADRVTPIFYKMLRKVYPIYTLLYAFYFDIRFQYICGWCSVKNINFVVFSKAMMEKVFTKV